MNLFMKSFSYLQEQEMEFKKEEPVVKEESSINVGQGKKFSDPEEAYKYLLSIPVKEIPAGYRNTLTKAFFHGTEEGQINTLFKDWKLYREKIIPKIKEFFSYIKVEGVKYPQCLKYVKFLQTNVSPLSPETFVESKADLSYFKFWVLFKFYTQQRS